MLIESKKKHSQKKFTDTPVHIIPLGPLLLVTEKEIKKEYRQNDYACISPIK
jgi:hypothetical protein